VPQQDHSLRRILQQSADRTPVSDAQITEAVDQAEQLSQYMESVVKALKKNRDEFRQHTKILQAMQMSVGNLDTKELL
jgi:tagatose-1,6-bisphosphate aldolase